jgi:hypothetical protein
MTTSTGTLGTITALTAPVTGWYAIYLNGEQSVLGAGCTGNADAISFQIGYATNDTGNSLVVSGANNIPVFTETNTSIGSTIASACNSCAQTAIANNQVIHGQQVIYAKTGTNITILVTQTTNTLTGCSPWPAFVFRTLAMAY